MGKRNSKIGFTFLNPEEIDKLARSLVKKWEEKTELCHYTSLEGFQGMLDSISYKDNEPVVNYWASSIFAMNDPEEMMHGYDCIWKVLPLIEKELKVDDKYKLSRIWKNVTSEHYDEYYNSMLKENLCKKNKIPFIISLSEKIDSLDLWRTYASDGRGVCIVFSEGSLKDKDLIPSDVDYIENITDGSIVFDVMKNLYVNQNIPTVNDLEKFDLFSKNLSFLTGCVIGLAPYIKKVDYEYEKEYRIISTGSIDESIKYRISQRGHVIPYKEIPIPVNTIQKVILGPCSDPIVNKSMLEMELSTKGLNIPVEITKTNNRQY